MYMEIAHHRFRQIHLDFHTSAQCEEVGADFDAKAFVETLQMGHVDTINIFARCHHGFSYYPTQVGKMHPNLKFDLLGAQIEALHKAGIRCPIYISVKWDDWAGSQHPEWVCVRKNGSMAMRTPTTAPSYTWTTMDLATGYADYFLAQLEEICDRYGREVDGFWPDICFPEANYSPWSQAQMRKAGVNLEDDLAVWRYARDVDLAFFGKIKALLERKAPQASCYVNGTTNADMGEVAPYVTQFEVESLPTSGAWGYLHYPMVSRQARTYGKEIIGMTGRFHKSWADFGGLKTADQLDYECGTILAAGGRICVGDQLHPSGVLDPAVYRTIGQSFARVEKLEPWLYGASPTAEVAILALGQPENATPGLGSYSPEVEGAAQMLLECAIQFDIVDAHTDLSAYPAVILPDGAILDEAWQTKLEAYLAGGGRLVLSGRAALDPATGQFQLKQVPVTYLGPAPTVPSYLRPDAALAGQNGLASDYDYVFYDQAYRVKAVIGAQSYGSISRALFNRTWEHFTSHLHAPVGQSLDAPMAVRKGRVLYFAAPLFTSYRNHDYWAYRAMVENALRSFLPPAMLLPGGPGWVEFALHTQPAGEDHPARRIVHVVAYHPRRTLQSIPHADQSWPTSGLSFKLRLDGGAPSQVYLAPDRQPLDHHIAGGYLQVDLPPINAHAVVVIE
jgi:hypothetical protein